MKPLQLLAGPADGDNLGVRRGIAEGNHEVGAFGQYLAVPNDDGSKRSSLVAADVVEGELDGAFQKCAVHLPDYNLASGRPPLC